ncbi:MAG: hypothetical protein KUL83_00620 [Lentimicrobium sp.]|jgi:hypothetical protein|nr:hypothetical protein [Lentimicrobium sp.]MDD2527586.1 hypothetical protein [Lentimicrobiaceae bacterium]MDD4597101.1 hypothetical protein [Lentimicrobiaceae bacterium]MDY0025102.1 hypothetical protein [Lentimicrobium sp.]
MKKLYFVGLMLLFLTSCKLENDSYSHFYDYVDIAQTLIPATAYVGDSVLIHTTAVANNGCWKNLKLFYGRINDTLYAINAQGEYESYNNLCPEVVVMADSIFTFIPDTTGTFIFVSQSRNRSNVYDTLQVSLPQFEPDFGD